MKRRHWFLLIGGLALLPVLSVAFRSNRDELAFLKPYVQEEEIHYNDYSEVVRPHTPTFVCERTLTLRGINESEAVRLINDHFAKRKGWYGGPNSYSTVSHGRGGEEGDDYVEIMDWQTADGKKKGFDIEEQHILTKFEVWLANLRGIKFGRVVT